MDLLTYSGIRKFERKERDSKALIKLDSDFIPRYLSYVEDKSMILGKSDDNIIARKVMERAKKELFNAESSFKSLFELRARKIIEQAFIDIKMGAQGLSDNMLVMEESFYRQVRDLIEVHEASLIAKGKFKKHKVNPQIQNPQDDPYVLVRFLKDIPVFAWKNGNLGPFKAEDVANIPKDLMFVLEKQGSIKIMR